MSAPIFLGIQRGFCRRCPNCGHGKLFKGYLKVQPICTDCGHNNGQYRADDAPPYFTMLLVGHLVVAPMLLFPFIWQAPVEWVLGITLPIVGGLTLGLLPLVKDAVVGLHWAVKPETEQVEVA